MTLNYSLYFWYDDEQYKLEVEFEKLSQARKIIQEYAPDEFTCPDRFALIDLHTGELIVDWDNQYGITYVASEFTHKLNDIFPVETEPSWN